MPVLSLTRLRAAPVRRRWVALAALWLLLCLLWTAPATLFAALLRATVPQLQLDGVTGSFWQGRAGQAHWLMEGRRFALGSLEWRLKPLSLLWLRPGAHIATSYGPQFIDAEASIGIGGLRLVQTRAALPVPALAFLLPAPAEGLLALELRHARFDGAQLRRLQGELNLQGMRWQWSGRWLALGDYRVQLQLEDGELSGDISGGSDLAATGRLSANLEQRAYRITGTLQTAAALPSEFRDGIGLILAAKPEGDGRWLLDRSGSW